MKKSKPSSCTGGLLYAAMVVATPALIAGGLYFGNQRLQIIGWILLVIVALPTIFRRKQKEQKLDVSELSDFDPPLSHQFGKRSGANKIKRLRVFCFEKLCAWSVRIFGILSAVAL